MARKTSPFPVNKPYYKVQRDLGTSHSSSTGKPDLLSYSYSCVQEFKNNQHIIRNLAILHEDEEYQGLSHQPELFTLTGERENPVYQPFYCSAASNTDQTETADLFETSNMPNFSIEEIIQSSTNTISDSEPIFFDKSFLLQWLKYQLKHVNSWWPFSKSKDYFFTRLCKKEKTMKMEMMLNNVDEETKSKIKRYVAELNLNLEERNNLCNESIIEIDITPIFSDTRRLQAFLLFLKNIEASSPKLINSQRQKHYELLQNNFNFNEGDFVNQVTRGRSLFQTNALNMRNKFNKKKINVMENKADNCRKDEKNAFVHPNLFNENSNYTQRNFYTNKGRGDHNNKDKPINSSVSESRRKHLRVDIKSNQKVGKKPRLKSTIAVNMPNAQIYHDSNTNTVGRNVPQTRVKRTRDETVNYYTQANYTSHQPNSLKNPETTDHESLVKRKLSCKCLIHQQREDYHRYKHQCLFGRGDETTSNLIKFVAVNENKYLSSSENKKIANAVSDEELKIQNKSNAKSLSTENNYEQNIKRETCQNLLEKDIIQPTIRNKSLVSNSNNNYEKYCSKPSLACNNSRTTGNIFLKHKWNSSKDLKSSDEISDTVTCDSLVDKLCFNTGHCQVVHIDDVEKLLCDIDYNKYDLSSKEADSFKNSINSDRLEESSNEDSNNLSFNACFESLNYSINSFTWNAVSETVNSLTEVDNDSESQGESTVLFKTRFSEMLAKTHVNKTLRNQAVGNTSVIASDRDIVLKNNPPTGRTAKRFNRRGFNIQNLGAEEYLKDFIYQDLKQISSDLLNYKKAPNCNNLDENAKQKINLFVSNAKELQTKMAYLSKKLVLKRKERDINYKTKTSASEELGKMNMVIKISGLDIKEEKQLKSSKISFSSFRPTNIYQSISSVFKGTHNCDPPKGKRRDNITVPKREKSTTGFEQFGKHVKYDKHNSLIRHKNTNTNKTNNSSVSSVALCPEKLNNLIFNNLEKLNIELKSQQNEIEALKKLILQQKKY